MVRGNTRLLIPGIPTGEVLLVVGLIGTTVVPYNLFLHASVVQERYAGIEDLADMRRENVTAIILGGLISICIVITSATNIQGDGIKSAADMAQALEPFLVLRPNMYLAWDCSQLEFPRP